MRATGTNSLSGEILNEELELSFDELCHRCQIPADRVFELVAEGLIEPRGAQPEHWRFHGISVVRLRTALRLQRDLGVNPAGAALALDLMEELEELRCRLRRLEG